MTLDREQLLRFLRFLCAGGTAAVIALSMRALLFLVLNFEVSVALGHLSGMVVAFYLNLRFVFPHFHGRLWPAFLRFSAVNMLSLGIAVSVSSLAYRWLLPAIGHVPVPDLAAHVIGVGFSVLPSFVFHSAFSFRTPGAEGTGGAAPGIDAARNRPAG